MLGVTSVFYTIIFYINIQSIKYFRIFNNMQFLKAIFSFMDVKWITHLSYSISRSIAVLGRWSLAALILTNQASGEYIDVLYTRPNDPLSMYKSNVEAASSFISLCT